MSTHSSEALAKLSAALMYGTASLLIMFVNKFALTVYRFPSFTGLALAQCVATVALLAVLKAFNTIKFPDFAPSVLRRLFPLPLFFILNLLSGLGGTQRINVAMLTVLRRFTIPLTLFLNWYILNRGSTRMTQYSIFLMVFGAVVAASYDLTFDSVGMAYVLANDVLTALVGVLMEKKLDAKDFSSWGLMYYNSLFSIPVLAGYLMLQSQEWEAVLNFSGWSDAGFMVCFLMAAVMGVVLQYSTYLCTQVNSALTTSVVGCMKNVLTAYFSILGLGGDYVFSWMNFLGINISIFGSLVYAYVEYQNRNVKKGATAAPSKDVSATAATMNVDPATPKREGSSV